MTFSDIQKIYEQTGGEFITPPVVLSKKLKKVKALIFDWDGVFHAGQKTADGFSTFSEVDSMGLNMLRLGFYLEHGNIPVTAIITGENNKTAFGFAKREHLDAVFFKIKNKKEALDYILKKHGLKADEVLFVFDDILDLSAVKMAGVNFLMGRTANPMFVNYCKKHKLADYQSGNDGGNHGVREISELTLSLIRRFDETLENRVDFTKTYQKYWSSRNKIDTHFFTIADKGVEKVTVK